MADPFCSRPSGSLYSSGSSVGLHFHRCKYLTWFLPFPSLWSFLHYRNESDFSFKKRKGLRIIPRINCKDQSLFSGLACPYYRFSFMLNHHHLLFGNPCHTFHTVLTAWLTLPEDCNFFSVKTKKSLPSLNMMSGSLCLVYVAWINLCSTLLYSMISLYLSFILIRSC